MNRRSFMQSILAAAAAPMIFRSGIASGILMPVRRISSFSTFGRDLFWVTSNPLVDSPTYERFVRSLESNYLGPLSQRVYWKVRVHEPPH